MRKIVYTGLVVIVALMVAGSIGCNPDDISGDSYNTGYITTSGDGSKGGFDFSEGIARHDSLSDMIIEPWWDNTEPAPCIQHTAWGDSTKKIIDLGAVNLDDVVDLDPSNMVPDTLTQIDMWDVTKPMSGHAYYITTLENQHAFFFIDSMKVTRDSSSYTTDIWIRFVVK